MSKANAGYLFYKRNYSETPGEIDTSVNAKIEGLNLVKVEAVPKSGIGSRLSVSLTTTYPGLLSGTGYTHNAKDEAVAYKIGFFFDHTTGMPLLSGSSVKGTLRSLFPNRFRLSKKNADWWKAYSEPRYELIRSWIIALTGLAAAELDNATLDAFEMEVFEGIVPLRDSAGNSSGKPLSVYCRDIFLDAIPVEIVSANLGTEKRLFGNDYLTPHHHKDRNKAHLDPFAEPRPLQFLKVMPSVRYEFQFILHDSSVIVGMTAEKKLRLFEALLCFHGIGAKTHVGYGQFDQPKWMQELVESPSTGSEAGGVATTSKPKQSDPEVYTGKIEPGKQVQVKVVDPGKLLVSVHLPTGVVEVKMARLDASRWPETGVVVKANIAEVSKGSIRLVSYSGPI